MIEVKDSRSNSTHVYRESYDWKLNARRVERQSEGGVNALNGTTIYSYNENKAFTFMDGMYHTMMNHTGTHCTVRSMHRNEVRSMEASFGHGHIAH